MIYLLLFLVNTALSIWAFGAFGNYAPAPTLIFVSFFAAIVAGLCALRIAAHICERLFLKDSSPPKQLYFPVARHLIAPPSTRNFPVASLRPSTVCLSLPKSCWF